MAHALLLKRLAWRIRKAHLFNYHRNVYLLLLFTLGKGFQLSIGALSINLYAYSLGYRQDFIGLLSGSSAIGAFAAGVPIGLLADKLGRKPLLIISGLLNPFTLVALGLNTNAPLLILAGVCNGIMASAYWVTNPPLLTESTTADQRVGVLALNSFLLLGVGALGSLIGGAVPEFVAYLRHVPANSTIPLRWGLLVSALIVFLPALPLFFLIESPRFAEALSAADEIVSAEANDPQTRLAVVVLFLKLLIPDMLLTIGEGSVIGLLQLYFALRFHLQPGSLGILFTLTGLIGGANALLAPRLARRWGKLRIAILMQYLSVPAILGVGFAPVFPLAAGAELARNILRGFFDPIYATFAMESVSTRLRGTLSGFYSTTWSIGFSLGPALAGWLQVHAGLSTSFVMGAGCVASAATLLLIFFRPTPLLRSR